MNFDFATARALYIAIANPNQPQVIRGTDPKVKIEVTNEKAMEERFSRVRFRIASPLTDKASMAKLFRPMAEAFLLLAHKTNLEIKPHGTIHVLENAIITTVYENHSYGFMFSAFLSQRSLLLLTQHARYMGYGTQDELETYLLAP